MKGLILLFCVGIFLTSCGTLPKNPNNESILVIDIQNDEEYFDKYYVYFRLYYTKNDFIRIDPKQDMSITYKFEPGDYKFVAIQPVYYKLDRPYEKTEISIDFFCRPNQITVLKESMLVSFIENEDGNIVEHGEMVLLSDQEYSDVVDHIIRDKNFKYWSLLSY